MESEITSIGSSQMIQCEQCEYFQQGPNGEIAFSCDPFRNIKEPECLQKWNLIKTNQMLTTLGELAASYRGQLDYYRKLAPMQEKMFQVVERELDDINEGEKWKISDDEDEYDSPWNDDEDDNPYAL